MHNTALHAMLFTDPDDFDDLDTSENEDETIKEVLHAQTPADLEWMRFAVD